MDKVKLELDVKESTVGGDTGGYSETGGKSERK